MNNPLKIKGNYIFFCRFSIKYLFFLKTSVYFCTKINIKIKNK